MKDIISQYLINYNWMPCVSDWSIDKDENFYNSVGVSKLCSPKELNINNVSEIKKGDVIFVKTDYIQYNIFQTSILPLIKTPFVLISGVSDFSPNNYHSILENKYCHKWLTTNAPVIHEKIIPIPIGFQELERVGGNQKVIKQVMDCTLNKINKILLPYHTITNNHIREHEIEYLKNLPFIEVQKEKLNFEDYLKLLQSYKYCICLEGNGIDTHRLYESLLTNTIPIQKNNIISYMFNFYNVPCVTINNWELLTYSLFQKLENCKFNFKNVNEFLSVNTYYKLVEKYKNEII